MKTNWPDFIFGGVAMALLIGALYLCLSPIVDTLTKLWTAGW